MELTLRDSSAGSKHPIHRRLPMRKCPRMRKTPDGNSIDLKQFIQDLRILQDGQELLRSGLVGLNETSNQLKEAMH